jgi:Ca2+-binding RTX toxin-like protein
MLSASATLYRNGTLVVLGTKGDDEILIHTQTPPVVTPVPGTASSRVRATGQGPTRVIVKINGVEKVFESGVKLIHVEAGRGSDYVQLGPSRLIEFPEPPPGGPIPIRYIPWSTLPSWMYGGAGNDTLIGGSGADVMLGQDGHDKMDGFQGNDTMHGGARGDVMIGGEGNDAMQGGQGDDVLWGSGGIDYLGGNAGSDRLMGEDGPDHLNGGPGADDLLGGAGVDYFISDELAEGENDFEEGEDEPLRRVRITIID